MYAVTLEQLFKALTVRFGFAANEVHVQFGSEVLDEDGPAISGARGQATRKEIEKEVADLHKQIKPADTLWVIVLGHTHYDGHHSWLNLPGSDMHESDFGKLFHGLQCHEQVFFVTTAASGFYLKPLSQKGRVVISATEADLEVNETTYHLSLAELLSDPSAEKEFDVNEDGVLSLFEFHIAIIRHIANRYIEDELLSTEHAQLDDNGDGRGTELQLDYLTEEQGGRAKEGTKPPQIKPNADGALAARIVLANLAKQE